MTRRLGHGQNRRKTHIRTFHEGTPLIPCFATEDLRQCIFERWPVRSVHLPFETFIVHTGFF
jgi:hypothetical protein